MKAGGVLEGAIHSLTLAKTRPAPDVAKKVHHANGTSLIQPQPGIPNYHHPGRPQTSDLRPQDFVCISSLHAMLEYAT